MSLLDMEAPVRKSTVIFLIIENSSLLQGAKINTLNSGIAALVKNLAAESEKNAGAEIKIAALEYGSSYARWITAGGPVRVSEFFWQPLDAAAEQFDDGTLPDFTGMCRELHTKLSKKVFMSDRTGYYPPVIVLFSHSPRLYSCPDTIVKDLAGRNNWFKHADVNAVAIGKKADREQLALWCGGENVLDANTPKALTRIIASINVPRLSVAASVFIPEKSTRLAIVPSVAAIPSAESCVSEAPRPAANSTFTEIAREYKKTISKRFVSLSPDKMDEYLNGDTFFVTRKYDGELAVIFLENNVLSALNSNGNTIVDLPCLREAAKCLAAAGIKRCALAAELYVDESRGRSRVFDTIAALNDPTKQENLRLAFFDILSLDAVDGSGWAYPDTHQKLTKLFGADKYCTPVRYQSVNSRGKVKELFNEWVLAEGSEGLVVRNKTPAVVKIKPRMSVDAAIVGFSESDIPGFVRTLLYALVHEDNSYQVIGRTGNGLTGEQKKELYEKLMPLKIPSNYVEVDSNRAAFHLIKPLLVMELSINDVLCENTSGGILNPLLELKDGKLCHCGTVPGYSFVSAVIERFRDDKKADAIGARISQISNLVFNPNTVKQRSPENKASSTVLVREVYKKESAALMVMKFMVWKTNKEADNYPAYVFSFTNFSTGRSDPLSIDVRVSSSENQIMQIYRDFCAKNVKTGWIKTAG
ncbi:hypothetical protein FACS1894141_1100 [Spirochaetia bacterium]|nr:hypothetical protein FACS1894141_1100 [Spirochaetia bacterium]